MGSLKILDLLFDNNLIDATEYLICLEAFKINNGKKIRLPLSALQERMDRVKSYNKSF